MIKWLLSWIPVSRKRFNEMERLRIEYEQRYNYMTQVNIRINREMSDKLDERSKVCDEILKKMYSINFTIEGNREYGIHIRFDPSMYMFGNCYSDQLKYIAQIVAREVEHEIVSAKFVKAEYPPVGTPMYYDRSNNRVTDKPMGVVVR